MMQHFIQWVTPAVVHFHVFGYWLAFLAALAETLLGVGLLLPGSTLVLLLGAMSAHGYLDLGDLIWFAVVGAVAGDNINFHLGKKFGTRWAREGIWFLKKEHFDRATTFFERHGPKSVFWGRFIPSIKEMVPFIAGLAGMRRSTFMLWNILGGIGWGLQWVLVGYFFGQSLYLARLWLSRFGFLAVLSLAATFAFYLARRALVKYGAEILKVAASVMKSVKEALAANRELKELAQRHPRFFAFMGRRMNRETFTGLPLTLLTLSLAYVVILFTGIVEDFLTGTPIVAIDAHIANLIASFRTPFFIRFFTWITLLGKWQVITVFTLAFGLVLWVWDRRRDLAALLVILTGSQVFTYVGKWAFHRPRPELPVLVEHSFAFPSGHATVAVAFYGFAAYVLMHRSKSWKAKIDYLFMAVSIVLLIGTSRLYLGVHFLSDVWSGYLVGAMWLLIGIIWSRYFERPIMDDGIAEPAQKPRRVITSAALGASLLFYVAFAVIYHPPLAPTPEKNKPTAIQSPETIFARDRLKYTESLTGQKELPINIVIYASTDSDLIRAFKVSGWNRADGMGPGSIMKTARSYLFGTGYASAPLRPMFWNGRINNFGFETSVRIEKMKAKRVARIWRTSYVTRSGDLVYVGQATLAAGLIADLFHRFNLDMDAQREWLCRRLAGRGSAGESRDILLTEPASGQNIFGAPFTTDGKACLLQIKPGG